MFFAFNPSNFYVLRDCVEDKGTFIFTRGLYTRLVIDCQDSQSTSHGRIPNS